MPRLALGASPQLGHGKLKRTVTSTSSRISHLAEFTSAHMQVRRLVCHRKETATLGFSLGKPGRIAES